MDLSPCATSTLFSSTYPWGLITRHGSAFIFYCLAFVHWPSTDVGETINSLTNHHTSTTTFTLLFWTACAYHYSISAGRVQFSWSRSSCLKQHARGWLVSSSRRSHRLVLILSFAISSATVLQTSTLRTTMAASSIAQLLMVDFALCLLLTVYLAARLNLEPTGLMKRKAGVREARSRDPLPGPLDVDECSVCVSRVANRRLNCGHVLCCCCIADLTRHTSGDTLCPFCRRVIVSARRLMLVADEQLLAVDECCECDASAREAPQRLPTAV